VSAVTAVGTGTDGTEPVPPEEMETRRPAFRVEGRPLCRPPENMTDRHLPQRRRPAHHAPIERFNEPVIVEVTVCTEDRGDVLAHAAAHELCRRVWRAADFWHVGQYVIMPDHIHLFCTPGRVPPTSLRQWVEYWKSRIAAQFPGGTQQQDAAGMIAKRTDGTEAVPPGHGIGGPTSVLAVTGHGTEKDGTEPVPPELEIGGPTSVSAGPSFKLWQRDFWDTQMRSREHYEEKLSYVRMNPVRKGLAASPNDWPYQGEVFSVAWM
jgi:REP element-mobilizing transposase RayT